jgi:hypothetical protein
MTDLDISFLCFFVFPAAVSIGLFGLFGFFSLTPSTKSLAPLSPLQPQLDAIKTAVDAMEARLVAVFGQPVPFKVVKYPSMHCKPHFKL